MLSQGIDNVIAKSIGLNVKQIEEIKKKTKKIQKLQSRFKFTKVKGKGSKKVITTSQSSEIRKLKQPRTKKTKKPNNKQSKKI